MWSLRLYLLNWNEWFWLLLWLLNHNRRNLLKHLILEALLLLLRSLNRLLLSTNLRMLLTKTWLLSLRKLLWVNSYNSWIWIYLTHWWSWLLSILILVSLWSLLILITLIHFAEILSSLLHRLEITYSTKCQHHLIHCLKHWILHH